jgi:hypothetical protein
MTKKLSTLFIGMLLLSFLNSCEYELSKDYFRTLVPPTEVADIKLNLNPKADTIFIAGRMNVKYDFSSDSLDVLSISFEIGGETIYSNLHELSGTISIDATQFTPGEYKLKATMLTHSGSNSIADCIGAEGYIATKEWTLMLDNPSWQTASQPVFSKTPEGFLKISWTKCPIYTFDSYVLGLPSNYYDTIRDRNCTSVVDSMYIPGGMQMADLKFKYLYSGGYWTYSNMATTVITEGLPTPQVQKVNIDSIRIFWKRPKYNVRYTLLAENHYDYLSTSNLLRYDTDSSVVVAQAGFEWINYKLKIRSYTSKPGRPARSADCNSTTCYQGNWFCDGLIEPAYNSMDNLLYIGTNGYLKRFNVTSLANEVSVSCGGEIIRTSCSTNSSKVALITPSSVSVFSDKTLASKSVMALQRSPGHFKLCDNDVVVLISTSNGIEYLKVAENKIVTFLWLDSYNSTTSSACITNDARYTCVATSTGTKVYEYNTDTVSTKVSNPTVYKSCLSDLTNSYQVILSKAGSNQIEVRNISDFSLIRTITIPSTNVVLCNIDPLTGYLLATDGAKVYLINLQTGNTVYSMRCTNAKPRLYNGKLMSNNGWYIDLKTKLHV